MPAWQGKSRGTSTGYRIFVSVLKHFGLGPAYLLLRVVVLYYFFFSFRSSKVIFHYFHKRLHVGRLRSVVLLYRNYYRLGQTLIDKVVVMSGMEDRFTFNFDGEEYLHAITGERRGGLLLSAHIGNWEIAGHLLKRLKTPIHIVMYDGEHRQIKAYLDRVTGEKTMKFIIIKDDLSHIYAINEALKNNELVCIHADRFIEGNKTLTTAFMGEPARFPAGPFVLAATFKVPVSFVFACREKGRHYHFFATPPQPQREGAREAVMQAMLADFSAAMEEKARQYPEQWFNYYNFWLA